MGIFKVFVYRKQGDFVVEVGDHIVCCEGDESDAARVWEEWWQGDKEEYTYLVTFLATATEQWVM